MIWVDRHANHIQQNTTHNAAWVDDMKTPSGRIHVGALRGVVIHDLLYKALLDLGVDAASSYVFNDLDQMDAIPSYLEGDTWQQHSGKPLCNIPSPEPGFDNYAQYFAQEFVHAFESINCHPQIIWGSELYRSGKMNDMIRVALDRADRVRAIYDEESKSKRKPDWLPIQPICDSCGKMGTTYAYSWDGEQIKYRCDQTTKWAASCGHEGEMSPFDGRAKLHWKVDWPANWKVIGVTVEWSGKDHMSEGGSYDVSSRIAKEVFEYDAPYAQGYEWFTIGGRKMSSSKGIGSSAKEISEQLPPELLRFLLVRTPMERHLDFDPTGDTILDLYDDYDRCLSAYYDRMENRLGESKQDEVKRDWARIAELSQVRPFPDTRIFTPRFRTIVNMIKSRGDMLGTFEQQKGAPLNDEEKELLEERIVYAQAYVKNIQGEEPSYELVAQIPSDLVLGENQRLFLTELATQLEGRTNDDRETIQNVIFSSMKAHDLKAREVFSALYQVLIGKPAGPKAADLILDFGIDTVINRLQTATQ